MFEQWDNKLTQKLWLPVLFLTLAGGASAQIPTKGNVYFGYAYNHAETVTNDATDMNGWDASLEGKVLPWIGIVLDLNGNHGRQTFSGVRADVSGLNVLFGPRVSIQVGRLRPFGELLFGYSHVSRGHPISDSNTSFGNGAGGGLDYRIKGPVSLRGELDWINTRFYGHGQNDVRFTTGVAIHF